MSEPTVPPTADEVASAQAVLARLAAAQKAQTDAAMPAIRAFIADDRFAEVQQTANALREQLPAGTPLYYHLSALLVGMNSLTTDVAA